MNQVIAADAADLREDEDLYAEIRATDLTNEQELNVFVGGANWDDHVAKLEQSVSSGKVNPPLFGTVDGRRVEKNKMVKTIALVAEKSGVAIMHAPHHRPRDEDQR